MTTQSDLLKQAYELIRKTVGRKCTLCEIPSSYNQVYEPNITLIDGVPFHKHRGPSPDGAEWKCTAPGEAIWLRDYEAAEHCDGHNLGSGTVKYENCPICHAKYGAAPSPATEQTSYIEDLRRDLKDSAYAEKYLAAAKAESPEAYEVAKRDVTAATEQGPTDTERLLLGKLAEVTAERDQWIHSCNAVEVSNKELRRQLGLQPRGVAGFGSTDAAGKQEV